MIYCYPELQRLGNFKVVLKKRISCQFNNHSAHFSGKKRFGGSNFLNEKIFCVSLSCMVVDEESLGHNFFDTL